jgi:hypothetical protein
VGVVSKTKRSKRFRFFWVYASVCDNSLCYQLMKYKGNVFYTFPLYFMPASGLTNQHYQNSEFFIHFNENIKQVQQQQGKPELHT